MLATVKLRTDFGNDGKIHCDGWETFFTLDAFVIMVMLITIDQMLSRI